MISMRRRFRPRVPRHGRACPASASDAQVGRLPEELESSGLADNTIIILFGDHGWKLGDYGDWSKYTNFEFDAHGPLILKVPGQGSGQMCDAVVEYLDIYPTLAELCGLGVPEHCQGRSMVPLLTDPSSPWKAAAMSQYPRGKIMGYSIRTERWRYCEWIPRGKNFAIQRELYDHRHGPRAAANLVDSPEHAETVQRLAHILHGRIKERK